MTAPKPGRRDYIITVAAVAVARTMGACYKALGAGLDMPSSEFDARVLGTYIAASLHGPTRPSLTQQQFVAKIIESANEAVAMREGL